MKKIKIHNFFSRDSFIEMLIDIVYSTLVDGALVVCSYNEYIPPQYIPELLEYSDEIPLISDKYNNLWILNNDRESLKKEFCSDFLVEVRIIEDMNIDNWKFKFQIVEDMSDTYLEVSANNDIDLNIELFEEILKSHSVR